MTNERNEIITSVSGGVAWFVLVFFLASVVALGVLGGVQAVPTLAGLALAVLTVISFVFAVRRAQSLWFLCWLVPFAAVGVFVAVRLEAIRAGIIPVGPLLFACAMAYALALGFVIVAREHIRAWVQ